jgi:hypothetical protein
MNTGAHVDVDSVLRAIARSHSHHAPRLLRAA